MIQIDHIVENNIKTDHDNYVIDNQLSFYYSHTSLYHIVKYPQVVVTFDLISGNKTHTNTTSRLT